MLGSEVTSLLTDQEVLGAIPGSVLGFCIVENYSTVFTDWVLCISMSFIQVRLSVLWLQAKRAPPIVYVAHIYLSNRHIAMRVIIGRQKGRRSINVGFLKSTPRFAIWFMKSSSCIDRFFLARDLRPTALYSYYGSIADGGGILCR